MAPSSRREATSSDLHRGASGAQGWIPYRGVALELTTQRGRPDGVVEVVLEASALAAALERRAEPHQYADGHGPAQGAPHELGLAKRDEACAPALGGGRG
eukprot:scaffold22956_cov32-Phaeocystis_antarctica.AAC.2